MREEGTYLEAVEHARRSVTELFETLSYFEGDLGIGAQEMELVDFLEGLENHHENQSVETGPETSHGEELWEIQLRQAWAEGLSPDSRPQGERQPYPATLRRLVAISDRNVAAFDALCIHGAGLISRDQKLPLEMRAFLVDMLTGKLSRPRPPGRPKAHPARDPLLFSCLVDVAERFGLRATRNDATEHEMSACDIVAEAMRQLRHSPASYSALKRIWLEQNHQ